MAVAVPQPPTKSHSPFSKHERAGLETPDALLPFFDVATNLPDGMFPQPDVSAASFVRTGKLSWNDFVQLPDLEGP
jgi:hypothetical protein